MARTVASVGRKPPVRIRERRKNKRTLLRPFVFFGVTGFEPAASWSRTKHSTKLSHTPKSVTLLLYQTSPTLSSVNPNFSLSSPSFYYHLSPFVQSDNFLLLFAPTHPVFRTIIFANETKFKKSSFSCCIFDIFVL